MENASLENVSHRIGTERLDGRVELTSAAAVGDPLVVKLIQRTVWRSTFSSEWIKEIVDENTRLSIQHFVSNATEEEAVFPEIGRVDFEKQTLEQLRMRLDYVSRQRMP